MKKLGILMNNFSGGGAEKAALLLARGFAESGYSVCFIVKNRGGAYARQAADQFSTLEIGSRYGMRHLRLLQHLRTSVYDVLFSFLAHRDFLTASILLKTGLRVIPVIQTHLTENFAHRKGYKDKIQHLMLRQTLPGFNELVAISEGVKQDLTNSYGVQKERVRVIPNPVDLAAIDKNAMKRSPLASRTEGWLSSGHRLIAIGRLHPLKDFSSLLESMSTVARKLDDVHLLILGEGECRENLEAKVRELSLEDHITMPGFTGNPYFFLKRAHLLVLSSRCEGLGNVLVEALATGTNIVCTDCPGGPSEVVQGGEYGTLVPVGDPRAMADGILRNLKGNLKSPDNLRNRAERFDYRTVTGEYLSLL